MRPEEIESELLLYWIQSRELEEKGGPERAGELFEELLEREENLLKTFGLPPAEKYCQLLWAFAEKKSCTPKAIQKIINKLTKVGQTYLAMPVLPSLEMLEQAARNKVNPSNILPELGYPTHDYTCFLYNVLLVPKKITAAVMLQELETLHEKELYGPVAILKNNLKPTYRRTKAYKDLKANLRFLDTYLNTSEEAILFPEQARLDLFQEGENSAKTKKETQTDRRLKEIAELPEPEPYYPDYQVLVGYLEIGEIIFDANEAVTVNCLYKESYRPQKISLGFEFDELYRLLTQYAKPNTDILSYFNKTRQRNAIDFPTIVNLKEKLGKNLPLKKHYLRVYKPQALNRNGRPEEMREEFYLVASILDKKAYDTQQRQEIPGEINGWFGHVSNWYYLYLNAKANGLSDQEARKSINLENNGLFEIARLMYLLRIHGGRIQLKEQP